MENYLPFPELPVGQGKDHVRSVDAEIWVRKARVLQSLSKVFPNLDPEEIRSLIKVEDIFQQILAADRPDELPSIQMVIGGRENLMTLAEQLFSRGDLYGDPFGTLLQRAGVIWSELDQIVYQDFTSEEQAYFLEHLIPPKLKLKADIRTGFRTGEIPSFQSDDVRDRLERIRRRMEEGGMESPFYNGFTPIPASQFDD